MTGLRVPGTDLDGDGAAWRPADDPGRWPPLVEGLSHLPGEPLVAAYLSPPPDRRLWRADRAGPVAPLGAPGGFRGDGGRAVSCGGWAGQGRVDAILDFLL